MKITGLLLGLFASVSFSFAAASAQPLKDGGSTTVKKESCCPISGKKDHEGECKKGEKTECTKAHQDCKEDCDTKCTKECKKSNGEEKAKGSCCHKAEEKA